MRPQLLQVEPNRRQQTLCWRNNYIQLLNDPNFILALRNTTVYSLATVVISAALALPLAVFLTGRGRLMAFYQTVYFLPVITPMVPMAITWKWIYDYNYGLFNYALSLVGLPPVAWLTDPAIALWALVIVGVWKVLGYNLILFLVGIRNIPAQYLEAASLDGASSWQRFASSPSRCCGQFCSTCWSPRRSMLSTCSLRST